MLAPSPFHRTPMPPPPATPAAAPAPLADLAAGATLIAPLAAAVVPFGLLFGALAAQRGLSPLETGVMSATVFAGSAQFAALDQWTTPVAIATATATALLVNLRHVLMGASVAPAMRAWPRAGAYAALFFLVDETWAMAVRRSAQTPLTLAFFAGLAAPLYLGWVGASTLGAWAGAALSDPERFALDFVFPAVFLALLTGLWRGRRTLAPWLAAAAAAVVVHRLAPGSAWHVLAGGVAGVTVAALGAGAEDDG